MVGHAGLAGDRVAPVHRWASTVSAAAVWHKTMLPGVVWWSLPRNSALPKGVGKSLSAAVIPIVQALAAPGRDLGPFPGRLIRRAILWTPFDKPITRFVLGSHIAGGRALAGEFLLRRQCPGLRDSNS